MQCISHWHHPPLVGHVGCALNADDQVKGAIREGRRHAVCHQEGHPLRVKPRLLGQLLRGRHLQDG
jgi:hypothetical protein